MLYEHLTEAHLCFFAKNFARTVSFPNVVCLYGDLGAGKSTFCRTLIQTLLGDADHVVPSPTFTLVQEYECEKGIIYHFDLYRLQHAEDLIELNIEEALQSGLCLIEWPDRLGAFMPQCKIDIHIEKESDDLRSVRHVITK
ncbi:MAG TPA: tRNA (adenosine(37)-N6)-threonylcarbamoyltransferase complex ATPase subunit type 1 TsaE [Holosporales bacterium]|nr:tRNA (adenosine(37)-N6)-threonylcarbamoyltransferase complex ATPase subunit type 1 TsaE [Holosporales bacterium]